MTEETFKPILYIVMFDDVPDMNPGKSCAQAAHAQALFSRRYIGTQPFMDWSKEASGFGTTIVLHASTIEFADVTSRVTDTNAFWGIVSDPTYPISNYYGIRYTERRHTCAFFFAKTQAGVEAMSKFELHP